MLETRAPPAAVSTRGAAASHPHSETSKSASSAKSSILPIRVNAATAGGTLSPPPASGEDGTPAVSSGKSSPSSARGRSALSFGRSFGAATTGTSNTSLLSANTGASAGTPSNAGTGNGTGSRPASGLPLIGSLLPVVRSVSSPPAVGSSSSGLSMNQHSTSLGFQNLGKGISAGAGFAIGGHRARRGSLIDAQLSSTYFSKKELASLYDQFKRLANRNGKMDIEAFRDSLGSLGVVEDTLLCERLFHTFNRSNSGEIDFSEFAAGLSVLMKGTVDDKLEFAFRMADLDNSSSISFEELIAMVESMMTMYSGVMGGMMQAPPLDKGKILAVFESLDLDQSGTISVDEYKNAMKAHPEFFSNLFGSDSFKFIDGTGGAVRIEGAGTTSVSPTRAAAGASSEGTVAISAKRRPSGMQSEGEQHAKQLEQRVARLEAALGVVALEIDVALRQLSDRKPASPASLQENGSAVTVDSLSATVDLMATSIESDTETQAKLRDALTRARQAIGGVGIAAGSESSTTPNLTRALPDLVAEVAKLSPLGGGPATNISSETPISSPAVRRIAIRLGSRHDSSMNLLSSTSTRPPPASEEGVILSPASGPLPSGESAGMHSAVVAMQSKTADAPPTAGTPTSASVLFRTNSSAVMTAPTTEPARHSASPRTPSNLKPFPRSASARPRKTGKKGSNATQLHFGHRNWDLVTNVMKGVQMAVGRSVAEVLSGRPISSVDYSVKEKYTLVSGRHGIAECRFVDHAPFVFGKLRECFGIKSEEYVRSIGPGNLVSSLWLGTLNSLAELSSEGKSGSFFYVSGDGRYMIKTLRPAEHKLLRRMLPKYVEHMTQTVTTTPEEQSRAPSLVQLKSQSGRNLHIKFNASQRLAMTDSLLTRIVGCHVVRMTKEATSKFSKSQTKKVYIVVMENALDCDVDVDRRYDLKGSWVGRKSSPRERGSSKKTLKDVDFVQLKENLCVAPGMKTSIMNALKRDAMFLEQQNIIDYSFLLGVHDHETPVPNPERVAAAALARAGESGRPVYDPSVGPNGSHSHYRGLFHSHLGGVLSANGMKTYVFGIIDFFTQYTMKKRTERCLKIASCSAADGISVMPANKYRERFVNFFEEHIRVREGVPPALREKPEDEEEEEEPMPSPPGLLHSSAV